MKVFKRNADERSKMMSTFLDKPKEQHPIDLFFQSMAMTVKKFSPQNQIRARMQICQTVSQFELEELNRAQNVPQYDVMSSTSHGLNSSSQTLLLTNGARINQQFDAGSFASHSSNLSLQSPPILDDAGSSASHGSNLTLQSPPLSDVADNYDYTLLTNTTGIKFK